MAISLIVYENTLENILKKQTGEIWEKSGKITVNPFLLGIFLINKTSHIYKVEHLMIHFYNHDGRPRLFFFNPLVTSDCC